MALALGLLVGIFPLRAEDEGLTFMQASEILRQQSRGANSSRARLEIQMRLLSPEEQRQAGEFGELEHQLSSALEQLEKGTVAGTMDLEGGFVEASRLDYRQWKRELARIDRIKKAGPAGQLRQVGELINSRRFFQGWQNRDLEISRRLHRVVVEQVSARLLVAIQIHQGVQRPEPGDTLIIPSPR